VKNRNYEAPYYVFSSVLGLSILLSILFSNTLILCSSLRVRDHALHPHKTMGKIILILIFTFLDRR
jgi:hypothetical protein